MNNLNPNLNPFMKVYSGFNFLKDVLLVDSLSISFIYIHLIFNLAIPIYFVGAKQNHLEYQNTY